MRRRWIEITAALLGAIWLASLGVALFFVAGIVGVPWLLAALIAQIAAFVVTTAIMLVTNTHDIPNAPAPDRRLDPFSLPTNELRIGVELPDGRPYGRRHHDDPAVVKRLIKRFEDEDAQRPPPAAVPDWARDLQQEHGDE